MNYKGDYNGSTSYDVGDVVVFEPDNIPYYMIEAAPAGTTPHNVKYWARVPQPLSDVVTMFHGAFSKIPDNINDEAITLSTETADYLVTVDDSGDTPELVVTEIEEE